MEVVDLTFCETELGSNILNGHDFYPAIVDRETFEAAEAERLKRLEIMGRVTDQKPVTEERKIHSRFSIGTIKEDNEDPYAQAEYIYSLIESED